jgi:hypothetical protein
MLGCFRRRFITYYTGASDTTTEVYWLQSRKLSAEVRIPAGRPEARGRMSFADYSREELKSLADVEGGFAETSWDGETMHWSSMVAFQLHQKWPEPGLLRRIGDCMMEFAPSGAYVEDWRLQPSRPGPVVGLRMVREFNVDTGAVTHSGGGLVVCGDYAALVLGRPRALPACGRVSELIRDPAGSLVNDVFGCEASIAVLDDTSGEYAVTLSTHPGRHWQALAVTDGFSYDPETRLITQRVQNGGTSLERIFLADTLEPRMDFSSATSVVSEAAEWLERESDTLLVTTGNGNAPLI